MKRIESRKLKLFLVFLAVFFVGVALILYAAIGIPGYPLDNEEKEGLDAREDVDAIIFLKEGNGTDETDGAEPTQEQETAH